MTRAGIEYRTKTASEEELYSHLLKCKDDFCPPLDKRVDIKNYAKKLFDKSVTFEAWVDGCLIGLVAIYLNDMENYLGYVSSVSVISEYMHEGIASELLTMCIRHAKCGFSEIRLEVSEENDPAIRLYRKLGFYEHRIDNGFLLMKLELGK